MQRVPLRRDAVAMFSPSTNSRKSVKEWFEDDTHVKMQEVVFHMSAMSEYILRCAFISKQRRDPSILPFLIEERIQLHQDHNNREVVSFHPCDILTELSDENASICLEEALFIAHAAVLQGAKAECKRYGRKRGYGRQRKKINMSMLRQPLTEIMDRVVKGLETSVEDVVGIPLEFDIFHLQASRALRKVMRIYEIILGSHQEDLVEGASKDSNSNGSSHSRRKAYVYREPSDCDH
ncbi:hypothetical protein FGB62_380g00 [Gracilaria domingensis]|nr:hypothetical protein FGB62_405g04 [Gracilaria domingensis]KAI0556896.1 hypothetical protein FGB62_380g00 [Gracilaria domingensis]